MTDNDLHEAIDKTPERKPPVLEINTVRHIHRMGHEEFVRMWLTKHHRLGAMPEEVAEGVAVQGRIDHGRWLIDRPFCTGAELLDLEDLRFFCLSCHNKGAGGKWLAVMIPEAAERAAIEKAILERPEQFRHWRPSETVADVQITNTLHEAW